MLPNILGIGVCHGSRTKRDYGDDNSYEQISVSNNIRSSRRPAPAITIPYREKEYSQDSGPERERGSTEFSTDPQIRLND
eukprot:scaffold390180_cov113-Cyclotella_meneghiniana.AAC.2